MGEAVVVVNFTKKNGERENMGERREKMLGKEIEQEPTNRTSVFY